MIFYILFVNLIISYFKVYCLSFYFYYIIKLINLLKIFDKLHFILNLTLKIKVLKYFG